MITVKEIYENLKHETGRTPVRPEVRPDGSMFCISCGQTKGEEEFGQGAIVCKTCAHKGQYARAQERIRREQEVKQEKDAMSKVEAYEDQGEAMWRSHERQSVAEIARNTFNHKTVTPFALLKAIILFEYGKKGQKLQIRTIESAIEQLRLVITQPWHRANSKVVPSLKVVRRWVPLYWFQNGRLPDAMDAQDIADACKPGLQEKHINALSKQAHSWLLGFLKSPKSDWIKMDILPLMVAEKSGDLQSMKREQTAMEAALEDAGVAASEPETDAQPDAEADAEADAKQEVDHLPTAREEPSVSADADGADGADAKSPAKSVAEIMHEIGQLETGGGAQYEATISVANGRRVGSINLHVALVIELDGENEDDFLEAQHAAYRIAKWAKEVSGK